MRILLSAAAAITLLVLGLAEDAEENNEHPAPGIWSPLLEDLAVEISKRDDKVMKIKPGNQKQITRPNESVGNEVTETDLYLLGAIEKLVYRVDFLEKRLRRTEELLYAIMANRKQDNIADTLEPCPANFSRVATNCYHFSERHLNWKSAASMCRAMGANLAELDSVEENQDVVAYLQISTLRGMDFWTGGLYPGLLWIWANSARPINSNSSSAIIHGNGRCLMLSYNPGLRAYEYQGKDCSGRAKYICEYEQNSTSRALERIQKSLRQPSE